MFGDPLADYHLTIGAVGPEDKQGLEGPAGADGTSCTVTNPNSGSATLLCTNGTSVGVATADAICTLAAAVNQCNAVPFCNGIGACRPTTVFVTSTSHTGNLGGLAGADAICQARANEAGLKGNFVA